MDNTEDLSARILLRHILSTEPPKTPITRSVSRSVSSATRRSSRLHSKKDAGAQTPQAILRRSLKHKMSASITRKPLPAPETTTASVRRRTVPASSSFLIDDGDTPRHVLKNILQTEPVRSPVVHEKGPLEVQGPPSARSSTNGTRSSVELSALDLPDITIGNVISTAKGLSRKRPRRSLNVSAFEKRLRGVNDAEEQSENSLQDHSLSSLSSSSLSLKTPFADAQTEKRGLQRKVAHRRKISAEQFGAAVNRRQTRGQGGVALVERDASETAYSEGFSLGLSKLSEPDLTKDIVNCSTALYAQPDAMTSNFSIIATQDKPTVMASKLQLEVEDNSVCTEQKELGNNASGFLTLSIEEDAAALDHRHVSHSLESIDEAEEDEEKKSGHCRSEVAEKLPSEEEGFDLESRAEDRVETRTEDDGTGDSHAGEEIKAGFESAEGEIVPDCQTEEAAEAQTDKDGADPESQVEVNMVSEGDKDLAESQTEEKDAVDSHSQADAEMNVEDEPEHPTEDEPDTRSQSGEDVDADQSAEAAPVAQSHEMDSQSGEDEEAAESQTEEEAVAEHQIEEASVAQSQDDAEAASLSEEEDIVESQNEDGSNEEREQLERISRRSHRSEGALIVPIKEADEELADSSAAGVTDADSKAHQTFDVQSNLELEEPASSLSQQESPESSKSAPHEASPAENSLDADKENSFHQEVVSEHPNNGSADESAPQHANEKEEEWDDDDEENEDFPSKTPAFVREKRNFFHREPSASPSVLKNTQASGSRSSEASPGAKVKQVRPRKKRPAERKAALPKSYLMGVFKHFAKTKVSADVHPLLNDVMDAFFDRLAVDLETYAAHAKRKTIEVEDVVLLLKRQGFVNDKVPVEVLIEKYLRMDQRRLLIPVATSGNVVVPQKRK